LRPAVLIILVTGLGALFYDTLKTHLTGD